MRSESTKKTVDVVKAVLTALSPALDPQAQQVILAIKQTIADFSKLDDDKISEIINGEAKFVYEIKKPAKKPATTSQATVDKTLMEMWKGGLYACKTKDEAVAYIKSLKPNTNPTLKAFAKHLGCSISGSTKKDEIIQAIMMGTVGAMIDRGTIRGM